MMIWIQSVICALLFVANFAWHPTRAWLAIVLNVLLVLSCAGLVVTSYGRPTVALQQSKSDARIRIGLIAALFVFYIGASLFKLNGTSSALWNTLTDEQPGNAGLIAGSAKEIRLDEWIVHTPWIWSQANQDPAFPKTNRNVGDELAPLVTNLPVRDWTVLFRPQMWGFFLFDLERAFAFNWNFRWFGLLLGGFLFLRVVARGNDLVAWSGALLLLYSPYVQWFFSNPTNLPEMISMFCFGFWALHTLMNATSRWRIVGSCVVLLIALQQFAFCCYPRYQIPLAYLGATLLVGGIVDLRRGHELFPQTNGVFRFICFVSTLVLAAILLVCWYCEIAATFAKIRATVFPGQVFSTGGGFEWIRLFAPFLEFSMTQTHFPGRWDNVCEASGFLFVAPLLFAAVIRDLWKRETDSVLLGTVIFVVVTIWFMLAGLPRWITESSGWSYVVSYRAILVVGFASIIGLIRYLARDCAPSSTGRPFPLLVGTSAAIAFSLCLYLANRRMGNFATGFEVVAASAFFVTTGFFLWRRAAWVACTLLIIPVFWAGAGVNPISRGLPGITENAVFQWFSTVHRGDPKARWIVTGAPTSLNCFLAQLLRATGADVIGGTTYPPAEAVSILDPQGRFTDVHNRAAAACFVVSAETDPVFELTQFNAYRVRLPLRNDIFERLGVKYIVVVDQPETPPLSGFERIGGRKRLVLLRRQVSAP